MNIRRVRKEILKQTLSNKFLKRSNHDAFGADVLLGNTRVKPFEEIPGPKPLPILGNVWRHFIGELSSNNPIEVHEKIHKKYGDICVFKYKMGIPNMVYIFQPDEIEKMIRSEGPWPLRMALDSLMHYRNTVRKEIFGESIGLANAVGEDWHKLRSIVNPIFMKPQSVRKYISGVDEVATDFIQRMKRFAKMDPKSEMPANFHDELCKWGFESITVIALGRRMGTLDDVPNVEAEKIVEYLMELTRLLRILDFSPFGPLSIKYNLPIWKKFVKYQDFVTNIALKLMDESAKELNAKTQLNDECVYQTLFKIDQKAALLVTMDLLSAGVDTTGKFISAILYYLAKNVDVQNKLRREILENIPTKSAPITKEILSNLPYLRAVMKESGRISPIMSLHVRTATNDLTLSGYHIPKGTIVLMPTLYLSNNPEHYVRAKEFIPERWLRTTKGHLSTRNVNTFITIPFGYGPRSCVGRRLANLEVEVLLAKVIRNFELRWRYSDMRFAEDMFYGVKDPLRIRIRELE